MSEELKPCPFCGGKNIIVGGNECAFDGSMGYIVECVECEASTGWCKTEFDATEAWNCRAELW